MTTEDIPFNKQLRRATREVHSISDALVNAKMAFALSNNKVWAEGLLVFYEIFRFLEQAAEKHSNEPLGQMFVDGMSRTDAFEKDLSYYLGNDWKKSYVIRPAVAKYISHLQILEKEDPNILIAYVYHLYMGLLSGGQILKKKRAVANKIFYSSDSSKGGDNVTEFGSESIFNLKSAIIRNLNSIAATLDEKTRQKLLKESNTVFVLNNEIIGTIEGSEKVILKKLCTVILIVFLFFLVYFYLT